MSSTPSTEQLTRAIKIAEQIESLNSQLASLLNGTIPASDSTSSTSQEEAAPRARGRKKGKRVFSAATRAKMAASQQARHAKKNGASAAETKSAAPKKGRKGLSPEGRARIVAALKARHAAAKLKKG